uniref:Uncharacterized protein n=1 Tax=Manihot esculenta TaxID=3983 RepID=A0A2C9UKR7_MANES
MFFKKLKILNQTGTEPKNLCLLLQTFPSFRCQKSAPPLLLYSKCKPEPPPS